MARKFIYENLSVGENGNLNFAGMDTVSLAKQYGTPLYLMDENLIRERCKTYVNAANEGFDGNFKILYASKAASFKQIYRIVAEENMGVDVVSAGEIYTAVSAGFPMDNAFFHSNNKTDEDIIYAMDNGVGYFVVDNTEELYAVNRIAAEKNFVQKIILRLTPGIDTHTYEAINTGKVDSKFGFAIETGQADEIFAQAVKLDNIDLCGFHCHVGSQLFDSDVYIRSAKIMLEFISFVNLKYGFETRILDLGGGYGVPYVESDGTIDIAQNVKEVARYIKEECAHLKIKVPTVCFEPGRSIVADAGLTLYTAGSVKRITGYKNYVSVDGGMTDNIRFALYGADYTLYVANRMNEEPDFKADVVGKCCESGDIIQKDVMLPSGVKRGDTIACLTTGAYHYSMASNYNRIGRPPVVMIKDKETYVAVKRETLEHLTMLDE